MYKPPLLRPRFTPHQDAEFQAAEAAFSDDPQVMKVKDSVDMRSFWNSPAGKLLEMKAVELKDDGVAAMLDLDPEDDVKAWRKAKLKVLVSEQFMVWVAEVLQEGEIASDALNEQSDKMQSYRSTH